jgi:ferredoxin--NADP+ reductase
VILNDKGRVLDPDSKQAITGEYTGGWIKRGPTGVIGTNKLDAAETVACMMEDLARDLYLSAVQPSAAEAEQMIRDRQPRFVSYADWLHLNAAEVERGRPLGRPRLKFTRFDEMLSVLGR